jgi:hypothetical protein
MVFVAVVTLVMLVFVYKVIDTQYKIDQQDPDWSE